MSSYTVGPGELIFGAPGSPQEFSAQITSAQVDWETEAEDDIPLLTGGVEAGEETFTAVLSGNALQDLTEAGWTTYTWENKGQQVPVLYVPNTAVGRHISGSVKIRPTSAGGEAKTKARADFEFPFVGEPQLGDVVP